MTERSIMDPTGWTSYHNKLESLQELSNYEVLRMSLAPADLWTYFCCTTWQRLVQ
jgi:hypothetical protein